jgi:hypothetical protein
MNSNLKAVIRQIIREQMEEMPVDQPYVPVASRKQFSSEQLEKIIKNEIGMGTIHDQATLASFLDSLKESIHELENIPYEVFIETFKMEPILQQ